ncbi:hypothetical protein Ancab_032960, partial [Ancistrocladus abbreviatus]
MVAVVALVTMVALVPLVVALTLVALMAVLALVVIVTVVVGVIHDGNSCGDGGGRSNASFYSLSSIQLDHPIVAWARHVTSSAVVQGRLGLPSDAVRDGMGSLFLTIGTLAAVAITAK